MSAYLSPNLSLDPSPCTSPLSIHPVSQNRYAVGGVRITLDVAKAALLWPLWRNNKKKTSQTVFSFLWLALTFALLSLRHLDLALLCFARAGIGGVRAADRCECLDHGLWGIVCRLWGVSRRRTLRDGLMSRRATGFHGSYGTGECFFSTHPALDRRSMQGAPVTGLVGAGRHRWGLSITITPPYLLSAVERLSTVGISHEVGRRP